MDRGRTSLDRRAILTGGAAMIASACVPLDGSTQSRLASKLRILERGLGGTLGVAIYAPLEDRWLTHNAEMRFPMASTFKTTLAAFALAQQRAGAIDLSERVRWTQSDLVSHRPFIDARGDAGATWLELARAAQVQSDNVAANLLIKRLGGPKALTAFWRSLGDDTTQISAIEPEVNFVPAGSIQNTTSPLAMARTLHRLLFDEIRSPLLPEQRATLRDWMTETRTGAKRVRAGLPANWVSGDKTGNSGSWPGMGYVRGDIGFTLGPADAPIIFAAYHQAPINRPMTANEVDPLFAQTGEIITGWARDLYRIITT